MSTHLAATRATSFGDTATPAGPDEAGVVLHAQHLWKVFGTNHPAAAIEMAERGSTRAEVQAATGHTIGVRDVTFSVRRGETFVVMGLSGSGKSTLIRCLSRLVEPTQGSVFLDGSDLCSMTEVQLRDVRRSKMAMVFQHFGLFPHRRVIDNVAYGLEVQGLSKPERRERARTVLETVGLTQWAEHYPQQLSGGMQQRVGLARALAVDPTVLFFDEPFSALDPLIRRDMQDELVRLQQATPRTIVFITHDFNEALRLGDRIAIMRDGVFDQVGTAEELVVNPATDYVREFTNDIDRSRVLTCASVMTPRIHLASDSERTGEEPSVFVTDRIAEVVPQLLSHDGRVRVLNEHRVVVGEIDRRRVAALLSAQR